MERGARGIYPYPYLYLKAPMKAPMKASGEGPARLPPHRRAVGRSPIAAALEEALARVDEDRLGHALPADLRRACAHASARASTVSAESPCRSYWITSGSHWWLKRGASTASCGFIPKSRTFSTVSRTVLGIVRPPGLPVTR